MENHILMDWAVWGETGMSGGGVSMDLGISLDWDVSSSSAVFRLRNIQNLPKVDSFRLKSGDVLVVLGGLTSFTC